jgi:hypothetical protein
MGRKRFPLRLGCNSPTFRAAWERCALFGQCDEADGAEFRRVYEAWLCAGCPPVAGFIVVMANKPPVLPAAEPEETDGEKDCP